MPYLRYAAILLKYSFQASAILNACVDADMCDGDYRIMMCTGVRCRLAVENEAS